MTNAQQPAHPCLDFNQHEGGTGQLELRYIGLTKREYFTGIALQGLLGQMGKALPLEMKINEVVKFSVAVADGVLKQLEENG